jgi:hypothetical protein
LPTDYRYFLTRIGNGGAGPYYGVFPLGYMDGSGDSLQPWGGFIGTLSPPFPLTDAWNDLTGKPADELVTLDKPEYERQFDAFESVYWDSSRMNGAIPICHEGCAVRIWLVVSGAGAGYLWRDVRADYKGVAPLSLRDGTGATFSDWYNEWLEAALLESRKKISGKE